MSLYQPPRDEAARQDNALVDDYLRYHFRVEPPGGAPGPSTSERTATPDQPDEDAQFASYMRHYFPTLSERG